MMTRAHLLYRECFLFGKCEVPEQCSIIICHGNIFVRDEKISWVYRHVDHLFFNGIDPDTICVVKYLDHEREAA